MDENRRVLHTLMNTPCLFLRTRRHETTIDLTWLEFDPSRLDFHHDSAQLPSRCMHLGAVDAIVRKRCRESRPAWAHINSLKLQYNLI